MIRGLAVDASGEIALSEDGTRFLWAEGIEAAANDAKAYLRTIRGEWVLDARLGVPYLQEILGKDYVPRRVRQLVRRTLLEVPGIVDVGAIRIDVTPQREATIAATARFQSGESVTIEVAQ